MLICWVSCGHPTCCTQYCVCVSVCIGLQRHAAMGTLLQLHVCLYLSSPCRTCTSTRWTLWSGYRFHAPHRLPPLGASHCRSSADMHRVGPCTWRRRIPAYTGKWIRFPWAETKWRESIGQMEAYTTMEILWIYWVPFRNAQILS